MANSVGLIDAGYRNTLKVAVDNISNITYSIKKGSRLFQICEASLRPVAWSRKEHIVDICVPKRGEGGFGSTGV